MWIEKDKVFNTLTAPLREYFGAYYASISASLRGSYKQSEDDANTISLSMYCVGVVISVCVPAEQQ